MFPVVNTCFISITLKESKDFPDGPVVKNPLSNAGDMHRIPGQEVKIPHAAELISPCTPMKGLMNYN